MKKRPSEKASARPLASAAMIGKKPPSPSGWSAYYAVVKRIPRGRISTYGEVAAFAGVPRGARQVGYAMAALRGAEHDVPWHRVLGKRSRLRAAISILDPTGGAMQRIRLEGEGVEFDERGYVSLEAFSWSGPKRRAEKSVSSDVKKGK